MIYSFPSEIIDYSKYYFKKNIYKIKVVFKFHNNKITKKVF